MQLKDNIKFSFNSHLSMGNENCGNVLIHGDNKDILPELYPLFSKKIKCIYIDPPYNNGETYHYYNDNVRQDLWLKDMRYVLLSLKGLLANNGSIWISIDDSEMAYLKIEADKIFGRENFVCTIIWQQRKSRENRAVFSCNHEYILVYAKDLKSFKKSRNLLPVDKDFVDSKYKNPDNDPRGPWQSVTVSVQSGHAVASQFYTVVSPTGVRHNPPKGRCWIYNEERMKREIEDSNIWFGKEGKNAPRLKKFLSESKIGLTPETIWLADVVGSSDSAKKQLISLFPNQKTIFETPKPEALLKRIIEIASDEGDYVLDCFLGSGTTVAAAHKMKRHYIGIEVGKQMSDLVTQRLEMVIKGEKSGISEAVKWKGGGDFAFYDFDNSKTESNLLQTSRTESQSKNTILHYKQLDLFEVAKLYPKIIVENDLIHEDSVKYGSSKIKEKKNVLICYVKADNIDQYLNQSARIYYTGKRFPATVALNKLYYFIPYLKGKGIRDLYLIKKARVGTRKEGQLGNDPNDLRLVFEIEFVKSLFKKYKPTNLSIWHTFTDTTIEKIIK